jgi:hypothetical protein
MYFIKVTFIDGTDEVYSVGLTELPRDDETEPTCRIFMHVLSSLAKRKVNQEILKMEFVDPSGLTIKKVL